MPVEHGSLTLDQLVGIAGLGVTKQPPSSLLGGALQAFLHVLSVKWVRDFVFCSSPIHIPHLSSPFLSTGALTCAITWIGVVPNVPPLNVQPHFDASYHYNGHVVFVPTFHSENIVVGVGVFRAAGASVLPWVQNSDKNGVLTFNMRFVFDTANHFMALICHAIDDDKIYVLCEQALSTTKTKVFSGFFRSSLGEEALREENELRIEHVLPTILNSQDEVHHRDCYKCKTSPLLGCNCELSSAFECRPFDLEMFFKVLSLHLGPSQGAGKQVIYNVGIPQAEATIGSHASMECVRDADIIEKLSRWSLSDHMKRTRFDPLQSVLISDSFPDEMMALDDTDSSLDALLGLLPNTGRKERLAILDTPDSSSAQTAIPLLMGLDEQGVRDGDATSWSNSFLTCNFLDNGSVAVNDTELGTSCSEESVQNSRPTQVDGTGQNIQMGKHIAATQVAQMGLGRRGPRWILPRAGAVSAVEVTESPAELVRRMKEEEKKERNRASARRSNEKKKVYREKLKSDLASNRGRIDDLRKREMELREENRRLRNCCYGGSVK